MRRFSLAAASDSTGAGPAASQRAQLQRSAQCVRNRFVRTPASCVQHKKARRTRQQPPPAPGAGSDPSSPLVGNGQAAKAANAYKRAVSPLAGSEPPLPRPPSLAHQRSNVSPTAASASSSPAWIPPAAGSNPSVTSVPAHLFVLAAVVLIGGGYLVFTLAPKYRRPGVPKDSRRRREQALKHIRQAQEAAAQEDALTAGAGAGSNASGSGMEGSKGGMGIARIPLKLVTAGLPPSTAGSLAELLPSPACVTSTSAAIRNGLERIGTAVGAATAGARARARSVSSSVKGKERLVEDTEEDEDSPAGGSSPLPSAGLTVPSSMSFEGLTRRSKGKKGAKSMLSSPVGSANYVAPSQNSSRSSAKKTAVREIGVNSSRIATSNTAVQTIDSDIGDAASDTPTNWKSRAEDDSDPTPPHRTPAEVPDPSQRVTAEASVQTSPQLLRTSTPDGAVLSSMASRTSSAPSARPGILPIPFNLHASFQSTPLDPPKPANSTLSSSESNDSSSYPIPNSPPLSPRSRSRSPASSSAPRSSSASASASVSASPTSRRAASPTASAMRRESVTSTSNGHLAVDATPSRPRNPRRKSTAMSLAPDEQQTRGVVGLPGAVAAPRKAKADERGGAKNKTRDKERERDDERERLVPRRPSTASSSSASGASVKGASSGLEMSSATKGISEARGRDEEKLRVPQSRHEHRRDLHGLGVDIDDPDASGDVSFEASYPFPLAGTNGLAGTHTPGWTPDSSPHPAPRSLSGSSYGAALATPTAQPPPWSPQLMSQQYTMIPAPTPTRPPSRSSSLSVPSTMSPRTPLHAPSAAQILQHESQQQLQMAHQQQQQTAYALAQAHAQAQVQAQYQHAVALQLQAQQQQRQQQQQQQQQQMRRQSGIPHGPAEDYDGFLSNGASPATVTPSGFVYPLSTVASPPLNGTTLGSASASSPLLSAFATQHHPQQQGMYALTPGASPTTATFPASASSVHTASVVASMFPYTSSPSPAGNYLASVAPNGTLAGSPYAHAHASPTQAHFQQAQLSRSTGSTAHQRPRLQSSVSAVAALGSGSKSGSGSTAPGSPGTANGLSHSLGPGSKASRTGGDKALRGSGASSTRAGHSANGSSAPISGGVQLGDPPGSVKNRLRQAEIDADRTAKELEIARWKIVVLEDERKAADIENQEALRALATRAMRAEARIRLIEEGAKGQQSGSTADAPLSTPASSAAPSTTNSPVAPSALLPVAGLTPLVPDSSTQSSPTSTVHPLSWLDLDAVSFQGPRPLAPPRSPTLLNSPGTGNSRWRNKRNSGVGGNGGRWPGAGQRRKSGNSPTTVQIPPAEVVDTDDEDVLIVLDAPMRRRSAHPRQQTPSRRSSYAPEDEALEHDVASLIDEDEIPSIDVDESEPIVGGAIMGESEDGTRQHREYIGFLPSRLSPRRVLAVSVDSPVFDATECSVLFDDEGNASTLSVPSFILDASPEPDELDPTLPDETLHSRMPSPDAESPDSAPTPISGQPKTLPSSAQDGTTSTEEHTPRIPTPLTPPLTSPRTPGQLIGRQRTNSPSRSLRDYAPEDTPLPPSPLVGTLA